MKQDAYIDYYKQKYLYNDYYYWEEMISTNADLFEGYFNNSKITKDSKIIYTGFLNAERNIMQCGFATYPSAYSLLGFIQNIFLSTSMLTWFNNFSDGFCIPMATFDTVLSELTNDKKTNLQDINAFAQYYEYLNNLWNSDEKTLISELINFAEKFNNKWDEDPSKKLFIKIFNSPKEIYNFIMATIKWDFDDFVKEEISMDKETLKTTCKSVLAEPFINEKFIDILNTNIPILF